MIVVNILLWLLGSYAAGCTAYLLLFSLAGHWRRPADAPPTAGANPRRMAVLLPAYREDAVIVESVRMALTQAYPVRYYDIVVIADSLLPATLRRLATLPVRVINVSFTVPTKAKALAAALAQLPGPYDAVVILDADNRMAPDCLALFNRALAAGYRAVQGHRTAKNTNTSVAVLDAVSEEINNHIFRRGHRALGLPAALIGSGMAFDYALLREIMPRVQVINGVDREIELELARRRIPVAYAETARIYDEKVPSEAVLERQRTRWLAAQGRVLRTHFWPGLRALAAGNWGYADKVLQQALLPRVLLLGLLPLLMGVGALAGQYAFVCFASAVLLLLATALRVALPAELRAQVGWAELRRLPAVGLRFVRSLLNLRQARDRFLHTPHGTAST